MARKIKRIPVTDSVEELAAFWDSHDLTDFADELEEVPKPVFAKKTGGQTVAVALEKKEAAMLKQIAESKGVKESTLVRRWIREHLSKSLAQTPRVKPASPTRRVQHGS